MQKFLLTALAVSGLSFGAMTLRAADKMAEDKDSGGAVTGVLIDNMCGAKQMSKDDPEKSAAAHERTCAVKESCAKSGYAIISGKELTKLDESGNKMAKEYLAKPDASTHVTIEGKKGADGKMSVTSIEPADGTDEKMSEDKMGDDDKKADDKVGGDKMDGKMSDEKKVDDSK